jgi:hypothetical protein
MKARFTKGQEIYRIHTCWDRSTTANTTTEYLKITKDIVDTCGQKRLTLVNDDQTSWMKQFNPNQANGYCSRLCIIFHSTYESALKEATEYINFHNGMISGTGKYKTINYFELIK